jgi:sugar phosphate permease
VLGTWGVDGAFFAGSAVMLTAWTVVLLLQRNKPEDVGLPPLPEEEAVAVAPDQPAGKWPVVLIVNVGLIGAFYFCVKFLRYALDSWVPFLLARDYGLDYDDAGYVSLLFPVGGTLGVVAAGVLSDRWFGGRRAGISFWFVSGLVVTCLALYTFGGASLTVFAATQLFLGFFLYGPDALLTGAGAMDVGSRRRAVVAAGLINGTGTLGAVLQELVLGRLLDDSDSNAVFGVLLGSAVGALFFLGILVFRGRGGPIRGLRGYGGASTTGSGRAQSDGRSSVMRPSVPWRNSRTTSSETLCQSTSPPEATHARFRAIASSVPASSSGSAASLYRAFKSSGYVVRKYRIAHMATSV